METDESSCERSWLLFYTHRMPITAYEHFCRTYCHLPVRNFPIALDSPHGGGCIIKLSNQRREVAELFRIGEFSKLTKTTIKTLRYYDKVGLLKPAFVDSATSYRYYTEGQIPIMRRILALKDAGLSNDDIARILDTQNGSDDMRQILLARRKMLEESMAMVRGQLTEIERLLAPSEMSYTAKLQEIPTYMVYCCRGYVQTPAHIRTFITDSAREFRRTNPDIRYSEPDYCCVIYPEESYRDTNLFIEYAQAVEREGMDSSVIKFKELPGILAVCVTHYGSYDSLRDAYLYALHWAAEHGYELSGSPRERYIDGAWNQTPEEKWRTDVQLPVRRKEDSL